MARHNLGPVGEFELGTLTRVTVGDRLICVANNAECGLRAIDDVCTHEEQSLSEGDMIGTSVECPAHGSLFDLVTGAVTGLPAFRPTRVYQLDIEESTLFIELPEHG